MKKNWKTTFFGFSTIVTGIACIIKGNVLEGLTAISAGFGLGVAKDHNN
jgi:hypothetical protein